MLGSSGANDVHHYAQQSQQSNRIYRFAAMEMLLLLLSSVEHSSKSEFGTYNYTPDLK